MDWTHHLSLGLQGGICNVSRVGVKFTPIFSTVQNVLILTPKEDKMRNLLLKIILMLFGIYLLFLPLNFHGSLILIFQYSSLNRQIYLHGLAPQQKKESQKRESF